jgi:hypothetical protein
MVTQEQLRLALERVQAAADRLSLDGTFHHFVPIRFQQWIEELPREPRAFAAAIAVKAGQDLGAGDVEFNGRIADAHNEPSLEALVLHYQQHEGALFPPEGVRRVREKVNEWGGIQYAGPWP